MPGQRQRTSEAGETLEPVVADAVARAGYDLEHLQIQQAGRRQLVKVVVDTDAESGIGLDQVAEVSRAVSTALDALEGEGTAGGVLGGSYTLEVTSPGLDRPLTRPRHWRRARLRKVAVRTGEDAFTARVGDADDHGVRLLVDGDIRYVSFADIDHAVIEIEFREPPAAEIATLEQEEGSR
ncbi:ribosome maturation factor RimP [Actinophytocola xinjiangensis]|uniref:ribosome maturation factor RimP n=1 Tax=Actinophytocola xinjiangensis TaxID=485602 RepID=UPI000B229F24|nr:ribosome maturation factor RimP [Actinophytocola xinjiangensis]